MLLLGLTEQATLAGKLRAPLSKAGLKLLNLDEKNLIYSSLYSPTPHIFLLHFGCPVVVHLLRGRAGGFFWLSFL